MNVLIRVLLYLKGRKLDSLVFFDDCLIAGNIVTDSRFRAWQHKGSYGKCAKIKLMVGWVD